MNKFISHNTRVYESIGNQYSFKLYEQYDLFPDSSTKIKTNYRNRLNNWLSESLLESAKNHIFSNNTNLLKLIDDQWDILIGKLSNFDETTEIKISPELESQPELKSIDKLFEQFDTNDIDISDIDINTVHMHDLNTHFDFNFTPGFKNINDIIVRKKIDLMLQNNPKLRICQHLNYTNLNIVYLMVEFIINHSTNKILNDYNSNSPNFPYILIGREMNILPKLYYYNKIPKYSQDIKYLIHYINELKINELKLDPMTSVTYWKLFRFNDALYLQHNPKVIVEHYKYILNNFNQSLIITHLSPLSGRLVVYIVHIKEIVNIVDDFKMCVIRYSLYRVNDYSINEKTSTIDLDLQLIGNQSFLADKPLKFDTSKYPTDKRHLLHVTLLKYDNCHSNIYGQLIKHVIYKITTKDNKEIKDYKITSELIQYLSKYDFKKKSSKIIEYYKPHIDRCKTESYDNLHLVKRFVDYIHNPFNNIIFHEDYCDPSKYNDIKCVIIYQERKIILCDEIFLIPSDSDSNSDSDFIYITNHNHIWNNFKKNYNKFITNLELTSNYEMSIHMKINNKSLVIARGKKIYFDVVTTDIVENLLIFFVIKSFDDIKTIPSITMKYDFVDCLIENQQSTNHKFIINSFTHYTDINNMNDAVKKSFMYYKYSQWDKFIVVFTELSSKEQYDYILETVRKIEKIN